MGSRGTVLQVGPLRPSLEQALVEDFAAAHLPDSGSDQATFVAERGRDVTVIVTSGRARIDADLMATFPNLGAVVNFGVGYEHIDVRAAADRGVAVSNTPDVLTDCVADTAVGLIIDTMRQFSASDRYVRAGRWPVDGDYPLTRQVSRARVGIIGLGRIGSAIAQRLSAFGCPISYHSRHRKPDARYPYVESPVELAGDVDVLVVAAAGGEGTRALVNREVIDALGPQGYLVNIARGSVIDQDELVAALVEGRLAGAGLDVFADEPHVPEQLFALDNVVLLPHVGSATEQTRGAMEALTLENLEAFLTSGALVTPV
ncbi:2-hydroxyacid dehydrogenase [Mycolicibacterium sp. 3033]|nr:2-hydroxyacid dehydrogenase [Mycolicibacterium aurantiacum]